MWRKAVVVGVVVTLQVSLPFVGLTNDRPGRFGWQMYAGRPTPLTATVMLRDDVLVRYRPDTADRSGQAMLRSMRRWIVGDADPNRLAVARIGVGIASAMMAVEVHEFSMQ